MPSSVLRRLPLQLIDPRGRATRTDFLAVAVAMLGLQVLLLVVFWQLEAHVGRLPSLPINLLFLYMALCATTRRLHDLGRSAWWMPLVAAAWVASGGLLGLVLALLFGPQRLQPGAPVFWLVFLLLMVPALLCALWLHLTDGEPGPNRFGPPVDGMPPPKPRRTPKKLVDTSRIAAHA